MVANEVYAIAMPTAPGTHVPVDRRVRKTRASLHGAMVALLTDHAYGEITVEALIDKADISRATFYAHYSDKDDLFVQVVTGLTATMLDRAIAVASIDVPIASGAAVYETLRYTETFRPVYLAMFRGAGRAAALQAFRESLVVAYGRVQEATIAAFGVQPRLPLEVVVRAWVGEHLELMQWWLESGPDYSAADLTRMRMHLMTDGPLWARGFQPGQITFDSDGFDRVVAAWTPPPAIG
ncbi:MAG: hypothetical protein QOH99_891 [Frankiaceae bacterium]|nr:hypothetical protein [Frankiaceae bacterium]